MSRKKVLLKIIVLGDSGVSTIGFEVISFFFFFFFFFFLELLRRGGIMTGGDDVRVYGFLFRKLFKMALHSSIFHVFFEDFSANFFFFFLGWKDFSDGSVCEQQVHYADEEYYWIGFFV